MIKLNIQLTLCKYIITKNARKPTTQIKKVLILNSYEIDMTLCKETENIVIKYSFGSMITTIKVVECKFIEELP